MKRKLDPVLYISFWPDETNVLTYSVVYQGSPLMADTQDLSRAWKVAEKAERETKQRIGFWNGEQGKFVEHLP